jgi:DNA-binding MarR family transcriptional regulator
MSQESGELFYVLQRAANDMHKHLDQMLLERLGIGVSQLRIVHVVQAAGRASQRTLADSLGQTEASISRQMKLLAAKGLIETRVNPKNQRERLVQMTTKGLRLTEAADADLARGMQQLLGKLSDKQQKQFMETLNALRNG